MGEQLTNTPPKPVARFMFAHGAGAGKESEFMQTMATLLCAQSIDVVRFDFPYMQTITKTGKRRPPDKADTLLAYFTQLVNEQEDDLPLFIGGKSMGGRMATMLLDLPKVNGAVVFGYPFHPPGKPDKTRIAHLAQVSKPLCVVQGERDTFGTKDDISQYSLDPSINITFLPDGDHSLKPRKASGYTLEENLQRGATIAAAFIKSKL